MNKILTVIVLTLALNFIALAGAVGWLFQSGKLNREKVQAIREVVFPTTMPAAPATQPAEEASTTQPSMKLEELLAKAAGRSASDQVDFINVSFNAKMDQLDRRRRELTDLQRVVDLAREQLTRDRATLEEQQKALDAREKQATRLASDKGFQDSLEFYNKMAPKQVKDVFMSMDDPTMLSYLQAMQPRTATKILKEFKAADEQSRIQKILKQLAPTVQASIKE